MLVTHHVTPLPHLGKEIYPPPPYLRCWLPLAITHTPPFLSFLGNSSPDYARKYPPPLRIKWEHACGPHACEWGGGGQRLF